jgi:hypothetical protein
MSGRGAPALTASAVAELASVASDPVRTRLSWVMVSMPARLRISTSAVSPPCRRFTSTGAVFQVMPRRHLLSASNRGTSDSSALCTAMVLKTFNSRVTRPLAFLCLPVLIMRLSSRGKTR